MSDILGTRSSTIRYENIFTKKYSIVPEIRVRLFNVLKLMMIYIFHSHI